MKNLLVVLGLFMLTLVSCQPQPVYVQQQPIQQDIDYSQQQYQQVPVTYNGTSFFMDYLLYTSLMRHGGYGNVYNYYHSHPNDIHVSRTRRYYSRSNPYPGSRGYRPYNSRSSSPTVSRRPYVGRQNSSRPSSYSRPSSSSYSRSSSSRSFGSSSRSSSRPSSSRSSSHGHR